MSELKGLSNSDLISIGFKPSVRFTVGKQHLYQLSRGRYLSAMCIGRGNESVWLCHKGKGSEITDLICVHNRDYDGFITLERLKALIEWFGRCGDQNLKNNAQSVENIGDKGGDQKTMIEDFDLFTPLQSR